MSPEQQPAYLYVALAVASWICSAGCTTGSSTSPDLDSLDNRAAHNVLFLLLEEPRN